MLPRHGASVVTGGPVVVIGAGAAGLMAAIFAARTGAPVLLLERTADGGRKILISGGGRCNVLPSHFDPAQYFTDSSPHILRNVLRSFPDRAQRRFFENDLGVPLALEPETGKLFPVSNKAREVRDTLVAAARSAGAELRFETRVTDAVPEGGHWVVRTEAGDRIPARAVVFATGGLSVPQTGSDGTGLRIAARLGHTIRPTYPALTPLTLQPPRFAALAGVSLEVVIRAGPHFETSGGFLFTHRGYSGPSVLNASHLAVRARERGETQPLLVQWAGDEAEWLQSLAGGAHTIGTLVRRQLPDRLAEVLLKEAGVAPDRKVSQATREERRRLLEVLVRHPLPHTGDEGYRKAEVTGGGVALEEIDAATMQSRLQPGLYLCGEVLDAFGPIGGYNFAWAWASGRLAGMAAARA